MPVTYGHKYQMAALGIQGHALNSSNSTNRTHRTNSNTALLLFCSHLHSHNTAAKKSQLVEVQTRS